jgi:hypothetical protein
MKIITIKYRKYFVIRSNRTTIYILILNIFCSEKQIKPTLLKKLKGLKMNILIFLVLFIMLRL